MAKFIIATLVLVVLVVVSVCFALKGVRKAHDHFVSDYMKPDTTITIHNGRPDTVITQKSKPFWLN